MHVEQPDASSQEKPAGITDEMWELSKHIPDEDNRYALLKTATRLNNANLELYGKLYIVARKKWVIGETLNAGEEDFLQQQLSL